MPPEQPDPSPLAPSATSSGDVYLGDDWLQMVDGSDWDGKDLLELEVESKVDAQIVDIPRVHTGSNAYGFHLKLSDQSDVLARFANADVNMPNYDGFSLPWLHNQLEFEAATYRFLETFPDIPTPRLLYYRHALQHDRVRGEMPKDISGRRLMIFEMAKGESRMWRGLEEDLKLSTLTEAATVRSALLSLPLPPDLVSDWLLWRTFQPVEWVPKNLPSPISTSRDFWVELFKAKIEALIKGEGDTIGWVEDGQTVGPKALAAKQSLLRFIPHMLLEGRGR